MDEHGASRQRQSKHHSHARTFLPSQRHRGNHTPQALGQASKWKNGRRRSNTARREIEGTNREATPSNPYSKSILGTIKSILKVHTRHRRIHTQSPYSAPSNPYSKSILGTIESILKIHTRDHRIHTQNPYSGPSNPYTTPSNPFRHDERRPFPTPTLYPRRLMRNIPLVLKHMARHLKATSQGTHSVIDWMPGRKSPRVIRRMGRPCVRIQVRRMGASARHVAWSARLQESNHAQAY